MNIGTVARAAGGVFGIVTGIALFGKLNEVSERLAILNHNQLLLNGYDPNTGKKQQPERYQIFEQGVTQ